jgi:RNA polymerase sigma-70 factor (ECF subfamily)
MKPKLDEDEALMLQVAHGERAGLEPLVRRYANRLLTFLLRLTGDRHRSEELFQEVFLTVWQKREQYQFPRPFKPWLYQIALNKCREAMRSRRRVVPLQVEAVEVADGPAESAIATETAALVGAAVTRLPSQQQAVVVLRIWDGLSYAEIADLLGRKEATVRANMHHGLAALRHYLEPRLRN